jgi:peptide-methionine (S)-S-oxide reductase
VFTHDAEQDKKARESRQREEAERGQTIFTEIVPFTQFWLAEDYHQKYRLRQNKVLMEEFATLYPDPGDFVNSTSAARVNGVLGAYGTLAQFESEIDDLGLSGEARQHLVEIAQRYLR